MDPIILVFIALAGLIMYGIYFLLSKIWKKLKGFAEQKRIPQGENTTNLDTSKFSKIIEELEQTRIQLAGKTKGLFKRAYLKTFVLLFLVFLLFAALLGKESNDITPMIFGSIMMGAVLGAIGAGIYTLIKKGSNREKFANELKEKLVSAIVQDVDSNLQFTKDGITKESFNEVPMFRGDVFVSEDSIKGKVDDLTVTLSECTQRNNQTSSKHPGVVYFYGLFAVIEFPNPIYAGIFRAVPKIEVFPGQNKVGDFLERGMQKNPFVWKRTEKEVKQEQFADKPYSIFSPDPEATEAFINDKLIKLLDFIYSKYDQNKPYLWLKDNKVYFAIEWYEGLFEPDYFLNKSLKENDGLAEKIHRDILNIYQVIQELKLFKEV